MEVTVVTTENLDDAEVYCSALDQRAELVPGCETWGITYGGGQRGQMTRWPNNRGAASFGAESLWGWWDGDILHIDEKEAARVDPDSDGESWGYNASGEVIDYNTSGEVCE